MCRVRTLGGSRSPEMSGRGTVRDAGVFFPPPTYRRTFRAAHTNAAGAAVREPTRTGIG